MSETTDWLRVWLLVIPMFWAALMLYAALTIDHGKLRDEIAALRAEVRCLAEQEDCDLARLLSELDRRR